MRQRRETLRLRRTTRSGAAWGLALVVFACGRGDGEADAHGSPAPAFEEGASETACFTAPDSIVLTYSDVRTSAETYDETGALIELMRPKGEWTGRVRIAEGELGESIPMHLLNFDPATGTLSFRAAIRSDTLRFSGTANCDRVSGDWQLYPTTIPTERILPRVR